MNWLFRRDPILTEVRRRGIALLLHSTHIYRNLAQILSDGALLTARGLREKYGVDGAARYQHDAFRYEKFVTGLDYLNCSVSIPNAELLYHRSRADWKVEWAHFSLDLSLLAHSETLYSPLNAAAERGTHVQTGVEGLRGLFHPKIEEYDRGGLPHNAPTHPQAEVLVRGAQDFSRIRAVYVADAATAEEVQRLCDRHGRRLKVQAAPQLFVWPRRLIK